MMILVSSVFLWKLIWSTSRFGRLIPSLLHSLFSVIELFLRAWISCMVGLRGTSTIAFILDDTWKNQCSAGDFTAQKGDENIGLYFAIKLEKEISVVIWCPASAEDLKMLSVIWHNYYSLKQQPCNKSYLYEAYNVQVLREVFFRGWLKWMKWFEAFKNRLTHFCISERVPSSIRAKLSIFLLRRSLRNEWKMCVSNTCNTAMLI